MTREIVNVNSDKIYAIVDLEKRCFDDPWTPSMIEGDMMHEFSDFLLLKVDGKNVGYMNMWIIDNSIELNRICIDPDYRKKGYADDLMNYLIDVMVEKNLDRIILEVAADNIPALKLYDKYGFQDLHVREKYYDNGADAIIKELVRDDI